MAPTPSKPPLPLLRLTQRQALTFGGLFLGSVLLWLITSLGQTYNYTYSVTLTYADHSNQARPVGFLPIRATVIGQGRGWAHLRTLLFHGTVLRNIELPYSPEETVMPMERVMAQNENVMPGLRVVRIWPDAVRYRSQAMVSKRVPVRASPKFSVASHFGLSSVVTKPAEVTVRAPSALLDTLEAIYTYPFDTQTVDRPFTRTEELKYPLGVAASGRRRRVQVYYHVEPLTEARVMLPVQGRIALPNTLVRTIPDAVVLS